MNKLCILGAGVGGLSLAEQMMKEGDWEITLIDEREYTFSRKEIFPLLVGEKREVTYLKDLAKQKGIEFINAKVEKINFNKRKISFKQAKSINFSNLVICCGLKSKDLSIKGSWRKGFLSFSHLDPLLVRKFLKISYDIIVYVSTFLGVKLAFYLSLLKKNIKVVADNLSFLGRYKEKVEEFLQKQGIDVYLGTRIEEVIGNSTVKATKVSLPKVFSSQLVFMDSGFIPCHDFLGENLAKEGFLTNYEGVYLLGDVINKDVGNQHFFFFNEEEVVAQSKVLARFINNQQPISYTKRVYEEEEINGRIERFLEEWKVKLK